jgi:spermidine synthase
LRFILSTLILLAPASLIAALFPLSVRALAISRESVRTDIAVLYSVDTLGAVAGTFVCGFFMLRYLGVHNTIIAASLLNLVAAGISLYLHCSIKAGYNNTGMLSEVMQQSTIDESRLPKHRGFLLTLCFGISGAAALSYEVLITKILVHHLQMHIYSFTIMLGCFLLGLGLGSLLCIALLKKNRHLLFWFVLAEAGIAVIGFSMPAQLFLAPRLQSALEALMSLLPGMGMDWVVNLTYCLIILLPLTMLMGTTLPLITALLTNTADVAGKKAGQLYAVNTLGGVVGIVLTTFVVIPMAGFKYGFFITAAANLIVAGVGLSFARITPKRKWLLSGVAVVFCFASFGLSQAADLKKTFLSRSTLFTEDASEGDVLFFHEDANGTVAVVERHDKRLGATRHLSMNGHFEGGSDIASLRAFALLGNLPFVLHAQPEKPKRVLVLAFGMGITLSIAAQHGGDSITCVEMAPGVLDAARYFSEFNHDVLNSSKINVVLEDARNFLTTTDRKYDIVILDATHPKTGDSWLLYTQECYESVKRVLAVDGVVAQWVPYHGLSRESFLSITKTFQTAFPHVTLWTPPDASHTIFVGTSDIARVDYDFCSALLNKPSLRSLLVKADICDGTQLLSFFAADEDAIRNVSCEARINSDDLPIVQFTPRFTSHADEFDLYEMLTELKCKSNLMVFARTNDTLEAHAQVYARFTADYMADMLDRRGYVAYNIFEALDKDATLPTSQSKALLSQSRDFFEKALKIDTENRDARWMLTMLDERH